MICQWFLLCTRPATQTRPHPVIGDVPVCDRCAAFVDAIRHRVLPSPLDGEGPGGEV